MRRSPEVLARSVMEALGTKPQNVNDVAKRAGCSWITASKYLELIGWIQRCPPVTMIPAGKRIEVWSREEGELPE